MPVEFPTGRKMHIARICGVNRGGEPVPDIWVDVLRIDQIKINTQEELRSRFIRTENQEVTIKLKWKDEDGRDGFTEESNDDETSGRKVIIVKVCSPDEDDPDDPEEWVPIPAIKKVFLLQSGKAVNRHFFDSVLADKNRTEVKIRRFVHYDTSIDDRADAAFENGDTVYVVPVDDYEFTEDSKDEDTYLEHEVVLRSNLRMTPNWEESPSGSDTKSTFTFKNQFLLDGSDEADASPGGEINPPWRLDPFQNIINVKWGEIDTQWLLTSYPQIFPGNPGFLMEPSISSQDGQIDESGRSGVSGSKYTVTGQEFYAYGRITIGRVRKKVFMAADPITGKVSIGTVENGAILWDVVWTVPNPVTGGIPQNIFSCSYANDAFFITYLVDAGTRLAVIRDPSKVSTDINPFAGIDGRGYYIWGGNVVYSKDLELYVTVTEAFISTEDYPYHNNSLVASTSIDGLTWEPKAQAATEYDGIGAQDSVLFLASHQSTVAFGNGVFVAAAGSKQRFDSPGEDAPNYVLDACAIAVSTNGTTWTVTRLPGTTAQGSITTGDYGGDTTAVVFCRDGEAEPGNDGYFVATGYEYGTLDGEHLTAKSLMWRSTDGRSWTQIDATGAKMYSGLSTVAKDLSSTIFL